MRTFRTQAGRPDPLGATPDRRGTNFALYAETARSVDLCLFDAEGEEHRVALHQRTASVWHIYVESIAPGQRYGYRVDGPCDPRRGLCFNPANLLLDPYARALAGLEDAPRGTFSSDVDDPDKDLVRATGEPRCAPLAVVTDGTFDWGDDAPPHVPMHRSVLYAVDVKALTMRHPDVSPDLRGSYLAVASDPIVAHLRDLGITALQLSPVQAFVDAASPLPHGLPGDRGQPPIAFFAPDVRYRAGSAVGSEVGQFKRMVKTLHAAGIEVILDAVCDHHTLDVSHPQTLRLLMDSLRYWVEDLHVDGFRFDLASALSRDGSGRWIERECDPPEPDRRPSFFAVVQQDPIIGRVKLIAEPWDAGAGRRQPFDLAPGAVGLRQMRNRLATLLLSPGTPQLRAGDELGPARPGSDRASCQNGETSGLDWVMSDETRSWLEFTRHVIRVRREHPILRRASFPGTRDGGAVGVRDLVWFGADGAPITEQDGQNGGPSRIGVFMAGSGLDAFDEEGQPENDDDLVLIRNASGEDLDFVLPPFVERGQAVAWTPLVDTTEGATGPSVAPGATVTMPSGSLKLFGRRSLGRGGLHAAYGVPTSTYRLQLQPGFGFREARDIVDYIDDLGIGGVYTSPYLRAERGSTHGYDVVDHASLNPELGTEKDYRALSNAWSHHRLEHLLDFVPNHIGIGTGENEWWSDVLENGPSSVYADFFDIEWRPPASALLDRVLLPVLERQFGEEVDAGNIRVVFDGGALAVHYHRSRFPASPRSWALVLDLALAHVTLPLNHAAVQELQSILGALRHLPSAVTADPTERAERTREKEIAKKRLSALSAAHGEIASAIHAALDAINANSDRLEHFLGEQNYRLSYWRVATEEINYRRFFDVNDLAAIRIEDPEVFGMAHALVLDLIEQGRVTGLRLDHTDGLYDPAGYLHALQASVREALRRGGRATDAPIYSVAEKILEVGEELPRGWEVSGTTGYDYLAVANGLWIDPSNEDRLTRLYADFAGAPSDYREIVHEAKLDVMDGSFSSEIHVLAHSLKRIADGNRRARDFTLPALVRVIKMTMAAFPVYRTYVRPDGSRQTHDEALVAGAIADARAKNPMMEASHFEFLSDTLMVKERTAETVRFAMRFQQLSGPIMAKGVEDTALYRYNRLVCLNEVGCDASRFGTRPAEFHAHNRSVLACWPLSMTTTTTHDTKRSEDVRARLAVLSEMPAEWEKTVWRFDAIARAAVPGNMPSRNDAYLFYQSAVGACPFDAGEVASVAFADRLVAYMLKAAHEAKVMTSWAAPSPPYDQALERFVRGAMASRSFVELLSGFVSAVGAYGALNSLAQVALRLAAPGVPDLYRGCESWDFSLVDPDNRRPVDYARLRSQLAELRGRVQTTELAADITRTFTDGRIKMYTTLVGLRHRRELPALFLEGGYEPLGDSQHVVAFERRLGAHRLVCVVPRLARTLTGGAGIWPLAHAWGDAALTLTQAGTFRNLFTGERIEGGTIRLASVFQTFPVAWLASISGSGE
jgi:(1->4)-alpha-D-glucan 1-alpha-D-glucosylmutase